MEHSDKQSSPDIVSADSLLTAEEPKTCYNIGKMPT